MGTCPDDLQSSSLVQRIWGRRWEAHRFQSGNLTMWKRLSACIVGVIQPHLVIKAASLFFPLFSNFIWCLGMRLYVPPCCWVLQSQTILPSSDMLTCFWFLGLQQLFSSQYCILCSKSNTMDEDRGNSDFRRLLINSSAVWMWWHSWQHSSWMLLVTAQTRQLHWNWSCKPTASRTAESQTSCTLIAQKSVCRADDYSLKLNIGVSAQVEKQEREQKSLRSETTWLHLIQPTVISGVT